MAVARSRPIGILLALSLGLLTGAGAPAADLPRFTVPGYEAEMRALDELHALHHDAAFSDCTLWDVWLPQATLWASATKREQYRRALLGRRIDAEGYVSMQQHRGMAHSEGWPFPAWQQSGGAGFHFAVADDVWARQMFRLQALPSTEGWEITGAEVRGIDAEAGLRLVATADRVTITTPPFRCGTIVAPFARIEWGARGLGAEARAGIEWLLEGEGEWPAGRVVEIAAPGEPRSDNVPLYRHPGHAGILTRYRLHVDHAAGAEIDLASVITAIDTRHPVTNPFFVRACCDFVAWTGDIDFLRRSIGRMRRALEFALTEFRVREERHALVSWVGHDGRSGIAFGPDGRKSMRVGHGVGNNYWDLLPFGAHDALATLHIHDAVRALADLERRIAAHPEWEVPADSAPFDPAALDALAAAIRADFQTRFWSDDTGRFVGWIDADGRPCDFGFTFVNLEALAAGMATPGQAAGILDWLDGRREVAGDTSRGADIYHWRFGPRSTTLRNETTYVWPWFHPESIPWGGQVQDGGAVLGFSHQDLMARLATHGPDDAWNRLRAIIGWFRDVRAEGGYRAFYAMPGRGTLQGGGTAGGLGLDHEFLESVLVPQVMLQGFLGFRATATGYEIRPRLPRDWPSLSITGIRFHDELLTITAHADGRVVVERAGEP
jgi:hypothetical protein